MSEPRPAHYFAEDPAAPSAERTVELWLPEGRVDLVTDRGVFGYGQVDAGTRLLLREAPPPPPAGDLLDLGCGTGAIAIALARRAPAATVWAVDVNARARALCERNCAANGVPGVRVVAPDRVPADTRFAAIWSNPPIRIGKQALHGLLDTWLALLAPGAAAFLVVHKHLGSDSLQAWLSATGRPATRLASSRGYRILQVVNT